MIFHGEDEAEKFRMGEYGYEKDDGEDILQAFFKAAGKIKEHI